MQLSDKHEKKLKRYRQKAFLFLIQEGDTVSISGNRVRVIAKGGKTIFFNYLKNPLPGPIQTEVENIDGWPA